MAFPVGQERNLVGELRTDSVLNVKLVGDDADGVKTVRVRVWGKSGGVFSREINASPLVEVKLTDGEVDAARAIDAYLYDLTAIDSDGQEQIIAKGKVTVV